MNIFRMHQQIELDYNKLSSNHSKDYPVPYIDDYINIIQNDFVDLCWTGDNQKNYSLGFEVTKKDIDKVSNLVVSFPEQPLLTPDYIDTENNVYEFRLKNLKYKYFHHVKSAFETNCGIVTQDELVRHAHLDKILRDDLRKPSKLWKRVIITIKRSSDGVGSSLYVYSTPSLAIHRLKLTYIKQPTPVFYGGYNTLEFENGDSSFYSAADQPVSCEVNEQYHRTIVRMVVQTLANKLNDTEKYQLQSQELLTNS